MGVWRSHSLRNKIETCLKAVEECILEKQIAAYDVVDLDEYGEAEMPEKDR